MAARPSGTGWGRGRAARSAGRHVALLRGALAAWAARCAGMMESFWNFLQLESAAGRGSRPSAAREGAPSRSTPGRVSAAPVGWEISPPGPGPPPGEAGGSPPPPLLRGWRGSRPALLGLGGGQGPGAGDAPPPAAWFPSRPVTSAKSQKPCGLLGRGRGRRRRHRGGQVARGAAAGKLRSGFLRPADPRFLLELRRRRASLEEGSEAALSQVSLLSQLPSQWATDRWENPGSIPQLPQQLALGGDSAPCWSESGKDTREGGPPISRSPEIQGSW